MKIQNAGVIPTRPCHFSLALQDSRVFADFNLDENEQIYLVRISFDGYGCCYPSWKGQPVKIDGRLSRQLLRKIRENNIATDEVTQILSTYFTQCGDAIWIDALQAHNLV